jgi:hypothetical protein
MFAITYAERAFDRMARQMYPPPLEQQDPVLPTLKAPEHMTRVQRRIDAEQERIDAARAARQRRDLLRFGKKVMRQKQVSKTALNRSALDSIEEWKKERATAAASGRAAPDISRLNAIEAKKKDVITGRKPAGRDASAGRGGRGGRHASDKSAKRRGKDKKYGVGQKRAGRRNDHKSSGAAPRSRGGHFAGRG